MVEEGLVVDLANKLQRFDPYPGVIHIEAISEYWLGATFMRMQEFYESPFEEIRGKRFLESDYMDLYADRNTDAFTYYSDWSGFNLPGRIVREFFVNFDSPPYSLNHKEQYLRKMINDPVPPEQFYLIGTIQGDDSTVFDHEIAHAMFSLNPEYRGLVETLMENLPSEMMTDLYQAMLKKGYCSEVVPDEIQAHLATDDQQMLYQETLIHVPETIMYEFRKAFWTHRLGS